MDDPRNRVFSAAVLVATAFRLRDEDGLLRTLRQLCEAVDEVELAEEAEAARTAESQGLEAAVDNPAAFAAGEVTHG